jgi:FtsP/CotA-like multicopper oxidase with cupredoxin domain
MITRRLAVAGLAAAFSGPAWRGQARAQPAGAATDPASDVGFGSTPTWTAQASQTVLKPGSAMPTAVWTFDGRPSSVLRVQHGRDVALKLRNETPLPLSFHLYGVRGPNAWDGGGGFVREPVAPGQTVEYRFRPPDAGTFLIRPNVIGRSAEPAERGLSALLIVDEAVPLEVDHDLPLLVDDWLLNDDGSLAGFEAPGQNVMGRLGNALTVNGRPVPQVLAFAPGSRLRLRLANACNARITRLRFEGLKPYVAAVDSQPTDTFEPLRANLPFPPGTRYDLLLDMPEELGARGRMIAVIGEDVPLLTLVAAGETRRARSPIRPLPPNPRLPAAIPLEKALRKDVVLQGDGQTPWTLNGASGRSGMPPLTSVKRGSSVVLALKNDTSLPQPLHLQGHAFRLLHAFDDGWEPYFLDTVQVPERKTVRIAFVADQPGRWLLASTVLERFDAGLWTWFEVT